MHTGFGFHGACRRDERLTSHLSAEHALLFGRGTDSPEHIDLDGLEIETLERLEAALFDAREPRTLVLVTRDPDLIRRCDHSVHLGDCHLSRPGHGTEPPPRP